MTTRITWAAMAVAALSAGSPAGQDDSGERPDGYLGVEQLLDRCREVATSSDHGALSRYGRSHENRPLVALTLSGDVGSADDRPALLITAGIDGRHRVGPETAVRVAERLLAEHAELLGDATVYVLPLANPDGVARNTAGVATSHVGTVRPVDDDRDGRTDEDGPDDINGDGLITMMRVARPPYDIPRTHATDPAEPRLLVEADAAKGQRPEFAVMIEGIDNDEDGQSGEDGPGGVDLDRNFPHEWPEHQADAGPHQLSEPESLALAKFVLEHPNIVAAVVYGRHDVLVNVPSGKDKDVSGRGPKVIDADDVAVYTEISSLFKELTGQGRAPKADHDGSFHAWLYAQRGIPVFATVVWGRPDPPADDENDDEDAAGEDEPDRSDPDDKPVDEEAAGWLAWSDDALNGAGFVDWTEAEHPTLGRVEVGGFVPGARMNPPASELETLADGQAAFAVALLERRPRLKVEPPAVRRLGPALYEVHLAIVNEGYFPTATAMARKGRSVKPTVVRLSVPVEDIVAGERVSRHWGIGGSGRSVSNHWILRVPDDAPVEVQIVSPLFGEDTVSFSASETGKEGSR